MTNGSQGKQSMTCGLDQKVDLYITQPSISQHKMFVSCILLVVQRGKASAFSLRLDCSNPGRTLKLIL